METSQSVQSSSSNIELKGLQISTLDLEVGELQAEKKDLVLSVSES